MFCEALNPLLFLLIAVQTGDVMYSSFLIIYNLLKYPNLNSTIHKQILMITSNLDIWITDYLQMLQ